MANCRATIPAFVEPECTIEGGRIVACAFVYNTIAFTDITDPAEWVDENYASDIIVFQEVSGSYAGGSPTEVAGKGNNDTRVVGAKHEATVRISGVKGNDAFWNAMNRSSGYNFAFVVGGDYGLLMYVPVDVSIYARPDVQEGLDTEVDWVVSIKWSEFDNPQTSNVPTGIFN